VRYVIYLHGGTPAEALRQALHSVYGVPPSAVSLGHPGPADPPGPEAAVVITRAGGEFSHELRAGDRLADLTHATQLELAQALCRATGTRALVDDGTPTPHSWILVTADGSRGRVHTDPDADGRTVLYAFEPIAGAPDLPVAHRPNR
jgi:hypothetical protein